MGTTQSVIVPAPDDDVAEFLQQSELHMAELKKVFAHELFLELQLTHSKNKFEKKFYYIVGSLDNKVNAMKDVEVT